MTESDLQDYLAIWHRSEDRFYASVMNVPELYTEGIQLVRAIADHLAIEEVESLPQAYEGMDIQEVFAIAESLDLPHGDFLDFQLAKGAAFFMRHREILKEQAQREVRTRILAARSNGESWVTLYHIEQKSQGRTYFQRLEMHLPDGCGIYSGIELDWERGRQYVVEPLYLDPETGEPRRELVPPDPPQEVGSQEELDRVVQMLRTKYSADDDYSTPGE